MTWHKMSIDIQCLMTWHSFSQRKEREKKERRKMEDRGIVYDEDVFAQTEDDSALLDAALEGNTEEVRRLLEKGVHPDVRDSVWR